jgi:transcriptional regulator of arginine metabolism
MRLQRQQAIRALLQGRAITTQQELLDALAAKGLSVDQSTLSRDLVEVGARKRDGRYQCVAEDNDDVSQVHYGPMVRSFLPCWPHLIVIRTEIGQAQPVALAIDGKKDPSVAATLAGDDTIFVATRNRKTQTVALRRLQTWFGDKRER